LFLKRVMIILQIMHTASLLETIPLLKTQFDWANLIFRFTFKSARSFLSFFSLAFVYANYYTLQENDELLEAVGRKLSRLTSYDAQKRLDHCSKRGEPVTMHPETLHNTLHPLLRSGLFSLTQQFIFILHRAITPQPLIFGDAIILHKALRPLLSSG
ncbi:hypothetical protein T01_6779, partial [Trichinella spiralis]